MLVLIMVGIPASGKSTLVENINHNFEWNVLSSDNIRLALCAEHKIGYAETFKSNYNPMVTEEHFRQRLLLKQQGQNVIIDQCNHLRSKRRKIMSWFPGAQFWAIHVETPFELCMQRNASRLSDRRVPEDSMEHFYKSMMLPRLDEGFSDLQFVKGY